MEKALERAAGFAEGQEQRIKQLSNDLDSLRSERNQLQADLTDSREDNQTLQLTVERLRAEKDGLDNDVVDLQQQRNKGLLALTAENMH